MNTRASASLFEGTDQGKTESSVGERRDSVRQAFGGPIWWISPNDERFQQGWLIERSSSGLAFLAKGKAVPLKGIRIKVSTTDPSDTDRQSREALITRVKHVHADLFLVATQLKPSD